MDPNETLALLIDAAHAGDADTMLEHAENLGEWIARGGFPPRDPRKPTIDHAAVSAFVNRSWQGIYRTVMGSRSEAGQLWLTYLHSPDGPKVWTLERPDGSLVDVTRG